MTADTPRRIAAIVVAKSAFAAAPFAEMQLLAERAGRAAGIAAGAYAFTEQGEPSLRSAVLRLRDEGFDELLLVPLLVPIEPAFAIWLKRALARWHAEEPRGLPAIRVAPMPTATAALGELLDEMTAAARDAEPLDLPAERRIEGSVVPGQRHRVLVCFGAPCNSAGAAAVWCHLRNEQERRALRSAGEGTMTAKTTCLGPCNLAPVVQVFPGGTYYGGVDEAGIDRIIDEHLLGGRVAEELAYAPLRTRQRLRRRP